MIHSDAAAHSPILLHARLVEPDAVRVEVSDGGSGFAAMPSGPARPLCGRIDALGRTGGYGLYLVDDQARRWGVEHDEGTCVWFELAASAAAVALAR